MASTCVSHEKFAQQFYWLSECFACVKWNDSWYNVFQVCSGVRQDSVLSPYLFAIYIDDTGKLYNASMGTFVILYADDILLMAPSVSMLQNLLLTCEREFDSLDMSINLKKTCCMHIGPRNDRLCANINIRNGGEIPWVDEIRYLGIFIVCSTNFR